MIESVLFFALNPPPWAFALSAIALGFSAYGLVVTRQLERLLWHEKWMPDYHKDRSLYWSYRGLEKRKCGGLYSEYAPSEYAIDCALESRASVIAHWALWFWVAAIMVSCTAVYIGDEEGEPATPKANMQKTHDGRSGVI